MEIQEHDLKNSFYFLVRNLISNAIKFSKNGNVWLIVKNELDTIDETTIYFEVKDDGIGIPQDKQESVFDNFKIGRSLWSGII